MKKIELVSINLSKIDKANLYTSQKGEKFLSAKIIYHDQPDRYGNSGMITQIFNKENRKDAAGEWVNTPILGNTKPVSKPAPQQNTTTDTAGEYNTMTPKDETLPF